MARVGVSGRHAPGLTAYLIAIYMGMAQTLRRYFWDPEAKKFSADDSWVVRPLEEGQTVMTAPAIVGDWVAVQTNGLFTNIKLPSTDVPIVKAVMTPTYTEQLTWRDAVTGEILAEFDLAEAPLRAEPQRPNLPRS